MTTVTNADALAIVGALWRALTAGGFTKESPSVSLLHAKRAFDAAWLQSLPLAIGENRAADQEISLLDPHGIERWLDGADVEAAYASQPRTRAYENLGKFGGGWVKDVAISLSAATEFCVSSSSYESRKGDASFDAHLDLWIGLIVQVKGSKRWLLRGDEGQGPLQELVTEAGDVLLMPPDVQHEASPLEYSLHLNFEIFTDRPLLRTE